MGKDTPFDPDGYTAPQVRWSGSEAPRLGWSQSVAETMGDFDNGYSFDGDPFLQIADARPVGRVTARTHANNHGLFDYLSTDAAFTRYEESLVWMQDRKAVSPNNKGPAQLIGGGKKNVRSKMLAGADGKRPSTSPWEEPQPDKYGNLTAQGNHMITSMMPDESTASTWAAPARAANIERMPVPVPTSSTLLPFATASIARR